MTNDTTPASLVWRNDPYEPDIERWLLSRRGRHVAGIANDGRWSWYSLLTPFPVVHDCASRDEAVAAAEQYATETERTTK